MSLFEKYVELLPALELNYSGLVTSLNGIDPNNSEEVKTLDFHEQKICECVIVLENVIKALKEKDIETFSRLEPLLYNYTKQLLLC